MQKPFTSRIELPSRLAEALGRDVAIRSEIEGALTAFSVWLGRNQTIFFPEYTDHGIDHVTNVLISAEKLVSEEAWQVVSSADVAAIVASVLLHDCAMHLTQDGFFELIDAEVSYSSSRIFSAERSWKEEYEIFQQEAARWDAARLMSVFGDHEPAELLTGGRVISDRQKLLVGEFIRRHHARLAHQIALNGVPGASGTKPFSPFSALQMELCDLYGFLARSHNLSIRSAADMLPEIRRRVYLGVHAPFVMAVLRIADYIQIDAARAPTQILQLRGLKSPVSRSEWAKHHAVLELHQIGQDPEALNVIADPLSVRIFSGLRLLFRDLQRELDESWALIGEVYGRFNDLKGLGLTVRRLVSNLDDPEIFEKNNKPQYIPKEMQLSTATAELLELLVGPLYGDRPSVGARELIQNSVDAVLERASFERRHSSSSSYEPLVEVELETNESGPSYLRVSDNGVGMTLETIEGFFLRAGASFRKSQWWKSEFMGEDGESKVRRSGRFGVGVLAAFLVGGRISVSTRHFLDASGQGLTFDLLMDGNLVEVARTTLDVGTSVTVEFQGERVRDALLASLTSTEDVRFCDWFLYEQPVVRYRLFENSEWKEQVPRMAVEFPLVSQESPWVPVPVAGFDGVYWSYEYTPGHDHRFGDGFVACNGIFVAKGGYRAEFPKIAIAEFGGGHEVRHPALLVDDPEGKLPLNIQRSGLAERVYPFQLELTRSIADVYARKFYLALDIAAVPENINMALESLDAILSPYHGQTAGTVLGLCAKGWLPLDETLLARVGPTFVVYELFSRSDFKGGLCKLPTDLYDGMVSVPWLFDGSSLYNSIHFIRGLLNADHWRHESFFGHVREHISGFRFFIRNDVLAYLSKKGGLPKFLWRQLRVVLEKGDWTVLDAGEDVFAVKDAELIVDIISQTDCKLMAVSAYSKDVGEPFEKPAMTPFASAWCDLVSQPWYAGGSRDSNASE